MFLRPPTHLLSRISFSPVVQTPTSIVLTYKNKLSSSCTHFWHRSLFHPSLIDSASPSESLSASRAHVDDDGVLSPTTSYKTSSNFSPRSLTWFASNLTLRQETQPKIIHKSNLRESNRNHQNTTTTNANVRFRGVFTYLRTNVGTKLPEEYDRRLALSLSEHLELPPPPQGYPVDPCLGFQTWYDAARGKRKNGRVYGAGGYAKTIKRRDKTFRMRLDDGEGSSRPPILTTDMLETVRNLAQTETAARQAEMEEMRRRQAQMEEELRRKTSEYEEAMRIANERALKFEQFMALHMNQGVGGRDDEDGEDDEEVD